MEEQVTNLTQFLWRSQNDVISGFSEDARKARNRLKTGFMLKNLGKHGADDVELTIPMKALTFVCALTGGGKTAMMINLALRLAMSGKRGAFITLEEPGYSIFSKVMASFSKSENQQNSDAWDYSNSTKQILAENFGNWRHAEQFKKRVRDNLRFFDATQTAFGKDVLEPTDLQDPRCLDAVLDSAMTQGEELDFIIIDYVQLLDCNEQTTNLNLKRAMQATRNIIGKHKAAIIMGAQIGRQMAFTEFEEWRPENLGESSDLEKTANMIVALKLVESGTGYRMGMRLLKNRDGSPFLGSTHELDFEHCYIGSRGWPLDAPELS